MFSIAVNALNTITGIGKFRRKASRSILCISTRCATLKRRFPQTAKGSFLGAGDGANVQQKSVRFNCGQSCNVKRSEG